MSLLSTDEFHIVLYPDRFALSHLRRGISYRGPVWHLQANQVVPARPGRETAWIGAIEALEAVLSGAGVKRARATVFLSNQLVRYLLVPWSDALSNDEEEIAMARHCFRNVYGDVADSWDLRLSPGKAGAAQLASAVDARLPEALRAIFERLGVDLVSLQPQLMAAYNANRASLRERSAWLLLQEPGSLCLARLRQGDWADVRMLRVNGNWEEELPRILAREAYLADSGDLPNDVLLCAPQSGAAVWPANQRWKLESLQLSALASQLLKHDERRAVAVN